MDLALGPELQVGLITTVLAALLTFVATVFMFFKETARSRRERQELYHVEACADLAERSWATVGALNELEGKRPTWEILKPELETLQVGLPGQLPRHRLAGVDAISEQLAAVMASFLARWAFLNGVMTADRALWRDMIESVMHEHGDDNTVRAGTALAEHLGFSLDDVEQATEEVHGQMFDQLRDYFRGALITLSKHEVGHQLELREPGNWPDYKPIREHITNDRTRTAI